MPWIPLRYIVIAWQHLPMLKTKYHGRTKHIDIRYHCIRDMVAHNEVVLKHISISLMIVDPLTKPIERDVFQAHVRSLGLRRI